MRDKEQGGWGIRNRVGEHGGWVNGGGGGGEEQGGWGLRNRVGGWVGDKEQGIKNKGWMNMHGG